jgi:TetR/AcrR family transcriptional regulator, transcriptional repressor for nem operon
MATQNVREKILKAGVDQFHRVGFNGSSVDDITSLAGVPKGSFYNHFKSKEVLAVEVLDRYALSGPNSILMNKEVSPLKRIKQYFAKLAEGFVGSGYNKGCLLGNFSSELSDHSDIVQSKLKHLFSDWSQLLASVIQEAQDAGEIKSSMKATHLSGFVLSAWQGTLLRSRALQDQSPIREFTQVMFHELLK